jgi:hypothetical protein
VNAPFLACWACAIGAQNPIAANAAVKTIDRSRSMKRISWSSSACETRFARGELDEASEAYENYADQSI